MQVSSSIPLQSSNVSPGNGDSALAPPASPDVLARARKIKLFLMDVDGT